jgi:hypothetical protein
MSLSPVCYVKKDKADKNRQSYDGYRKRVRNGSASLFYLHKKDENEAGLGGGDHKRDPNAQRTKVQARGHYRCGGENQQGPQNQRQLSV